MTTPAENKEIVRRLEAIWEGDEAVVDELIADDFENHNPLVPDAPPGREGFRRNVAALRSAFPDIEATTEDLVAEGDRVVFRASIRGTHEGELLGVEPTGREVAFETIVIFRIDDGQIAERWAQSDTVGLLRQLGALPARGDGVGPDA